MKEAVEIAELAQTVQENTDLLKNYVEKADADYKAMGEMSTETKSAIEKIVTDGEKMVERLVELEQKFEEGVGENRELIKSNGDKFVESEQFKDMCEGKTKTARLELKTAIINATGQNQPLVPADRQSGIIAEPDRVLHMRSVLASGRTSSNLIEYAKENVFTDNAGPTVAGSPEAFENVTKPESGITFTLATAAVVTLAHWIPASKQVIADSPMLSSYINGRLMYGLKREEDREILLGTGINGELPGLYTNRTAYVNGASPNYTSKIDVLRDAVRQAAASEYSPSAFVLHSADWAEIELIKDTQGRYIFGNPHTIQAPSIWGMPVVVTNVIAAGTFLCGAFDMAAQLVDREDATIEVSRENSDNFVKNMVTILAEERLALPIYRAAALIGGAY